MKIIIKIIIWLPIKIKLRIFFLKLNLFKEIKYIMPKNHKKITQELEKIYDDK